MPQISATVDAKTIEQVNKIAKENKRSFSEMVNILLADAVTSRQYHKPKK